MNRAQFRLVGAALILAAVVSHLSVVRWWITNDPQGDGPGRASGRGDRIVGLTLWHEDPLLQAIRDRDAGRWVSERQEMELFMRAMQNDSELAAESRRLGIEVGLEPAVVERNIHKARELRNRIDQQRLKLAEGDRLLSYMLTGDRSHDLNHGAWIGVYLAEFTDSDEALLWGLGAPGIALGVLAYLWLGRRRPVDANQGPSST